MRILVIIKEPFLDRIPSLKTLILYLANNGNKITLLTSKSKLFPELSTVHPYLNVSYVQERDSKFGLPTSVKLLIKTLKYSLLRNYDLIIGGDLWGNVICNYIKKLIKVRHMFFVLEYPQIIDKNHPQLNKRDLLEHKSLKNADLVITHDKYHKDFLIKNFRLTPDIIYLLPNASFTPEYKNKDTMLRDKFNIPSTNTVVLHSGGFGKWFKCKELSENYTHWSKDFSLVFHTGKSAKGDEYFNQVYNQSTNRKPYYSIDPLNNEELDKMISSADIGIALYSVEHLGYRAEQMGLAAGKIGNYLKCGIPVIATKLPSLTYLEEYKCGILIDDESQIQSAIQYIKENIKSYRENAFKCYQELWHPSNYLEKIISNI